MRISLTLKTYPQWKLNDFFSFFCFLDDLHKIHFLLDASIFTTIDDEKEKNQLKVVLRILLKFELKFWKFINTRKIHNLNTQKLNFVQNLVGGIPENKLSQWSLLSKTYRNWHSIARTIIVLNRFCILS